MTAKGTGSNYRIPDVALFLKEGLATNRDTHWVGGPNWLSEILSPGEQIADKLEFYAKLRVREVLVIDRDPWRIELHKLQNYELILSGASTLDQPQVVPSVVLPLTFQLAPGVSRPVVLVRHTDGVRRWHV